MTVISLLYETRPKQNLDIMEAYLSLAQKLCCPEALIQELQNHL
jgi:hypothetical protein